MEIWEILFHISQFIYIHIIALIYMHIYILYTYIQSYDMNVFIFLPSLTSVTLNNLCNPKFDHWANTLQHKSETWEGKPVLPAHSAIPKLEYPRI